MGRRLLRVLLLFLGALVAVPLGAYAAQSGGAAPPAGASAAAAPVDAAATPAPVAALPATLPSGVVTTKPAASTTAASTPAPVAALAPKDTVTTVPPLSPTKSGSKSSGPGTVVRTLPAPSSTSSLPDTGARPDLILPLGFGMLLMGLGLRLRLLARTRYRTRMRAAL